MFNIEHADYQIREWGVVFVVSQSKTKARPFLIVFFHVMANPGVFFLL